MELVQNSPSGPVSWICDQNSIDRKNPSASAFAEQPFPVSRIAASCELPPSSSVAGLEVVWGSSQDSSSTVTKRDSKPYHIMLGSKGRAAGWGGGDFTIQQMLRSWVGIGLLVPADGCCIICLFIFFLSVITLSLYLNH